MSNEENPLEGLHNAEIAMLSTANFGRDRVREGTLGLVQFTDRMNNAMLSWYKAKASVQERLDILDGQIATPLFIQFCGASVADAYERFVEPIAEQGNGLEGDYPQENAAIHEAILQSDTSINVFFETLEEVLGNDELVPEHVREWYSSDARRFHSANGGQCTTEAGEHCPGTTSCNFVKGLAAQSASGQQSAMLQ